MLQEYDNTPIMLNYEENLAAQIVSNQFLCIIVKVVFENKIYIAYGILALFTNTKMRKNFSQQVIRSKLTCDG